MNNKKTIRINTISISNIVTAAVVALLLLVVIIQTDKGFDEIHTSTSEYIICQNAASDLESASSYLTEQVQLFLISGDTHNMDLYFEEAEVTKRREKAIIELDKYYSGTDAMRLLYKALEQSVNLMDTEYHAMRLAVEAYDIDISKVNKTIQNYPLSSDEKALSKQEQRELALSLVSDKKYQETRNTITSNVNECIDNIITDVSNRKEHASAIFKDAYWKMKVSIVLLLILVIGVSLTLRQIIVKPLQKYDSTVKSGETLPLEGAYELQQLAQTYNNVYEENQENQKLLRHEADHDALTGIFNRGVFSRLINLYENGNTDYALILIDVDNFKAVNDTYGHSTGDILLQRVASVVKDEFRSMDYICRIGGDEFAVIMVNVSEKHKELISEKLTEINRKLSNTQDGVPSATLSIGVALSDRNNPGKSIYNDADSALYTVKENGRNGFLFYEGGAR